MLGCFNRVQFFATLWIVAHQAPQFMGFSRQEYGVRCHALLQGNLPNPGIEPISPTSPRRWQPDSLSLAPTGKPVKAITFVIN